MSVSGDGKDAGESGAAVPRRTRRRVAPSAASVLPEPFVPAPPTIPQIPRQRRPDGPTAIATASIPSDPPPPDSNLEFVVELPGVPVVADEPVPEAADAPAGADAPVAAGDLVEADDSVETVEGELLPAGVVPADDSPTLADYVPPALAIVTEVEHEDPDDYRGARRKSAPWRRYPVGAVAVAVLILLITGAVVLQAVTGGGSDGGHNNGLPGAVPGVTVPDVPAPAAGAETSPAPEDSPSGVGTPAASASRARASSQPPRSASAAPSTSKAAPPPPAGPRLVGAQSHKCVEYRSGSGYSVVIDDCDGHGNQQWRLQGQALVADNGWCLDVQNAGVGNGNAVWLYQCNNTGAQVWVRRTNNTWQNPHSGRCLTASNNQTGAGTPLVIWDCINAQSQIWALG